MTEIVTVLKAGTIIDRAKLNKLNADEMNTTLAGAYANGATVHIIDNVKTFFDDTALFTALNDNAPILPLILEKRGVTVSEEDLFIVQKYSELVRRLETDLAALVPPPPPYDFAEVPEGWTVETHLSIKSTTIRRAGSNNGSYCIGIKSAKIVWDDAAQYWSGNSKSRNGRSIRASDYNREPYFYDGRVEVGCQTIQRYELEQLALHMGWDFPARAAQAV